MSAAGPTADATEVVVLVLLPAASVVQLSAALSEPPL